MIGFVIGFLAVGAWSGSWQWGVAAGIVLGVISVWFYPTTRCWWCRGNPRVTDTSGNNWRNCRVCGGSGRRTRWLARLLGGGIDA